MELGEGKEKEQKNGIGIYKRCTNSLMMTDVLSNYGGNARIGRGVGGLGGVG